MLKQISKSNTFISEIMHMVDQKRNAHTHTKKGARVNKGRESTQNESIMSVQLNTCQNTCGFSNNNLSIVIKYIVKKLPVL